MEGDREQDFENNRFNAAGSILLLYTIPLIVLTGYTYWTKDSWNIWAVGLLLTSIGTYLFARLMHGFAHEAPLPQPELEAPSPPPPVPQPDVQVKELEQQVQAYSQMVEDWKAQSYSHEESAVQAIKGQEELKESLNVLAEEYDQYKLEAQHLIEEERGLAEAQAQTLIEQKNALEEKEQLILELEGKVRDLNYEIKTLLQLAEKEGPSEKRKSGAAVSREVRAHEEALW